MTTIKSYTDIEQSKKLAEILPLESADMYYAYYHNPISGASYYEEYPIFHIPMNKSKSLPCWSLAALLNVIPKHIKDYNVLRIDISENDTSIWYDEIGYGVNNDLPDITMESAIDACYEMIIYLHELNLL